VDTDCSPSPFSFSVFPSLTAAVSRPRGLCFFLLLTRKKRGDSDVTSPVLSAAEACLLREQHTNTPAAPLCPHPLHSSRATHCFHWPPPPPPTPRTHPLKPPPPRPPQPTPPPNLRPLEYLANDRPFLTKIVSSISRCPKDARVYRKKSLGKDPCPVDFLRST